MRRPVTDTMEQDSGFVVAMAPDMARRQLRVSAVLVALIAALTLVAAFAGWVPARSTEPAVVKMTIQAPGTLKVHQAGTPVVSGRHGG